MTTVNTSGGDYAEGDIDKRQGTFVSGDQVIVEAEAAFDVHGLENPYLGLRAFTYDERDIYAGREHEVEAALNLLTAPGGQRTLLFVTGASGSGKSSFAQAGLVPALEAFYAARHMETRRALMRPGAKPLAALADALAQLGLPPDDAFAVARPFLVGVPSPPPPPSTVCLLVIDQFEELFTQSDSAQRATIVALLSALPPFETLRTHVIATLRVDYLPELFQRQALYEIAKQGIELRAMNAEQLADAIQRPLRRYPEKRIQPEFLEQLCEDTAGDAAYLPLLQVTLAEHWREGSLTIGDYESLTDAIRKRADNVLAFRDYDGACTQPRPQDEQAAILDIFLALVDVSLDDAARRDVRRRRSLVALTNGDAAKRKLVDDLTSARLLVANAAPGGDGSGESIEIDIIHESLIANWERLKQTIAARRVELRQRVRFEQALHEWQSRGQPDDYLLEGVWLAEAEALKQRGDVALRSPEASAFVDRSLRQRDLARQRALRRSRITNVVLGALLLLAVLAGVGALLLWREAEYNAQVSRSQLLTAEGLRLAPDSPILGLRLLMEGFLATPAMAPTLERSGQSVLELARGGQIAQLADTSRGSGPYQQTPYFQIDDDQGSQIRRFEDGAAVDLKAPDGSPVVTNGRFDRPDSYMWCAKQADVCAIRDATRAVIVAANTTLPLKARPASVSLSPDGRFALVDYGNKQVDLIRTNDGQVIISDNEARDLRIDPDWRVVLAIRDGEPSPLVELESGRTLRAFEQPVRQVAYGPQQQAAVSIRDGETLLIDISSGETLQNLGREASRVVFSPGGAYYSVEDRGKRAWLSSSVDGRRLAQFAPQVDKLQLGSDDHTYVVDYDDRHAELRDLNRPNRVVTLPDKINRVFYNPQTAGLLAVYDDLPSELRWSDSDRVVKLDDVVNIDQVTYSADGRLLAVRFESGKGAIIDAASGDVLIRQGLGVDRYLLAPDASRAVVRYRDGRVALLNIDWARQALAATTPGAAISVFCSGPLKTLWSADDQQQFTKALAGEPPRSCRE